MRALFKPTPRFCSEPVLALGTFLLSLSGCAAGAPPIAQHDTTLIHSLDAGGQGTPRQSDIYSSSPDIAPNILDSAQDVVAPITDIGGDTSMGEDAGEAPAADTIQPDPCSEPALNICDANAVCTQTETSYTCICKEGFVGDGTTCLKLGDCGAEPCQNEGICLDNNGEGICDCPMGYAGAQCETLWLGVVAYKTGSCSDVWSYLGKYRPTPESTAHYACYHADPGAVVYETGDCNDGWSYLGQYKPTPESKVHRVCHRPGAGVVAYETGDCNDGWTNLGQFKPRPESKAHRACFREGEGVVAYETGDCNDGWSNLGQHKPTPDSKAHRACFREGEGAVAYETGDCNEGWTNLGQYKPTPESKAHRACFLDSPAVVVYKTGDCPKGWAYLGQFLPSPDSKTHRACVLPGEGF